MVWKSYKIVTRVMTLFLTISTTSRRTFSNKHTKAPKCWRIWRSVLRVGITSAGLV